VAVALASKLLMGDAMELVVQAREDAIERVTIPASAFEEKLGDAGGGLSRGRISGFGHDLRLQVTEDREAGAAALPTAFS
jgi:hypothetical protein